MSVVKAEKASPHAKFYNLSTARNSIRNDRYSKKAWSRRISVIFET